uniref:Transposase (Putative), gypsy type n=1 Tax=Tanacetum cinerariifolium TaxID=118510 RepID=A0A699GSI2_TANCI|nr:hypothetical protein [Tanacetum cinerariifolium]
MSNDAIPKSSEFNEKHYATLVVYPAPFHKLGLVRGNVMRMSPSWRLPYDVLFCSYRLLLIVPLVNWRLVWTNFLRRKGAVVEDVAPAELQRKKKRKTKVVDADEPSHPAKKLRGDYGVLGEPTVSGKSQSVVQRLLAEAVQHAEVRGGVMPTFPFVSSSVSTTPEREGRDHTELLAGANLQAEVDSTVRTFVPIITSATTATPTADPAATANERLVGSLVFGGDSSFAGGSHPISGGFSDRTGTDFLVGGIRTVVDPDSNLQRVYVPQWNVTNGFCMDDGARRISLSAKVRMRAEYNIKEKRRLKSVVEEKGVLLKSRCDEIKSLKAQLIVKEAEATEDVRLRDEAQALKDRNTNLEKEKGELEVKVTDLATSFKVKEQEVADLDVVVTSVKLQNDSLADQASAAGLQEKVTVYENFMSQHEKFQDENRGGLSAGITHGAGGRTLIDVSAYNPSTEVDYLSALQRLQSVNFSLIAELKANKDASVEMIINLLRLEDALAEKLGLVKSQPHVNYLMVHIHHSPDQRVVGASALSLSLDVSSSRVRRIRENIANHVSALRGVFVPLSELLSAMDLEGMEGTFGAAPDTTTALSVTSVFVSTISPISTDDYEIAHTGGEEGASADVEAIADEGADPFLDVTHPFAMRNNVYWVMPFYSLFSSKRSKLIPKASLFLTTSTSAVLKVGMPISAGITASTSYVNENGVSPLLYLVMVSSIPSGFVIIKPTPEPSMHDDPSVDNIHGSGSSYLSSIDVSGVSSSRRSTMKSARICPFTDVLGRYGMSCSPSSNLYLSSLPVTSGLDSSCFIGRSVITTIVCTWKYLFNRLLAVTKESISFSIRV